jgi:hypothetical protein
MTTITQDDVTASIGTLTPVQTASIIRSIQTFIEQQYNLSVQITPTVIDNALKAISATNANLVSNIISSNIINISGINTALPDQTDAIVMQLSTLVVKYLQDNLITITEKVLVKNFTNVLGALQSA